MDSEELLRNLRKILARLSSGGLDSEAADQLTNLGFQLIDRKIVQPLVKEGALLRKDLIKGYLKINSEHILNYLEEVSPNAALSLGIMIENLEEVELSAIFNLKEWAKASDIDIIAKKDRIFDKFLYSYTYYIYPELLYRCIAFFNVRSPEEFVESFLTYE